MPLKVRCTQCGKSAQVPDEDAGLLAVCAACGSTFNIPLAVRSENSEQLAMEPPSTKRRLMPTWLLVAGAMFIGALGFGAALLFIQRTPSTLQIAANPPIEETPTAPAEAEQPPAPSRPAFDVERFRASKQRAEQLVLSGDLEAAHRAYQQLETLIPGDLPDDLISRQLVESARTERSKVLSLLLEKQRVELARTRTEQRQPEPQPQQPSPPPTTQKQSEPPAVPAPSENARPPLRPVPQRIDEVTDEQIGRAIQAGAEALLSRFNDYPHTLTRHPDIDNAYDGGANALAVYALMQAGRSINDPRLDIRQPHMQKLVESMKRATLREGTAGTYARAIRATALSLFNRPDDRALLRADFNYLLNSHQNGAYTYSYNFPTTQQPGRARAQFMGWDNSNSQYGLLGVWSAAEVGMEVPGSYWVAVDKHWTGCQNPDGTWGYRDEKSGRLSMSVAGIASLFVTQDWMRRSLEVGQPPFSPPLAKGLAWLETGDNLLGRRDPWQGYTLYGIERVGLASGFKYFGRHDWYRVLAAQVLRAQRADGSWGNDVETAYTLLFLSRGRHPILMNKLRFDTSFNNGIGYWANRPRDLANLSRYASRQLEREFNWQVVPLERDYTDWLDSPILYLASHMPPKLSDADKSKLRNFVYAGGILFTHADGNSATFTVFAEQLARDLFPRYEMQALPASHPVYDVVFKVKSNDAPLRAVSNGSRLLMVHSTRDLARSWQMRDEKTKEHLFKLGVNLFVYASGKRDFRNRLQFTYITDPGLPQDAPNGAINIARLQYAGNWDPEPMAWTRFARWMHRRTGTGVAMKTIPIENLRPQHASIAHLTGTHTWTLTAEQKNALRTYVEAGGVLLIDPCGGAGEFIQTARNDLVTQTFPSAKLQQISQNHPLLRSAEHGMDDLSKPLLRNFTVDKSGSGAGRLSILRAGKGHVIIAPIDITTGLLGTGMWGIDGYQPDYCQALIKNVIFWTLDGQRETE